MLFALNHATDRPIYAQIGDRIKFAVVSGTLMPGELVPSVRELSKQLVVNPNTVARAYRDLQGDGILEPIRGTGLQVGFSAVDVCRKDRLDFVRRRLREVIAEVKQSGLLPEEVEAILRSEWSGGSKEGREGEGNGLVDAPGSPLGFTELKEEGR